MYKRSEWAECVKSHIAPMNIHEGSLMMKNLAWYIASRKFLAECFLEILTLWNCYPNWPTLQNINLTTAHHMNYYKMFEGFSLRTQQTSREYALTCATYRKQRNHVFMGDRGNRISWVLSDSTGYNEKPEHKLDTVQGDFSVTTYRTKTHCGFGWWSHVDQPPAAPKKSNWRHWCSTSFYS